MLKKISLQFISIVFVCLVSCDNEPYEGEIITEDNTCQSAIASTIGAALDFGTATDDNYSILCEVYKGALQRQIDACGDEDGSLQMIIDQLGTCELENPCDDAIAASEIARITYEAAVGNAFEIACNTYKEALENQIVICGDDGTLQSLIDELNDCEPEEVVEVVGTWKLVSWNTDELRDLDNDGIVTNNYLDDIDCYDNETILFNPDGTGTMFLRSTAEFTFTPNDGPEGGEDFFVVCTDISEDRDFTWTETINSVMLSFNDGTSLGLFKNGNLYTAINDAFYASSTVDDSVITERITFVYEKL
ncbi:hypothetical protein [Winogradskyella sp.]|uniref:hypothetical protein n=1 Tax=Winogradskyella sp. TaxID=1883156 RepID=UPI003BABF16C